MVVGGLMFGCGRCAPGGVDAVPCRHRHSPGAGLLAAPDILQVVSSAVRNLGLMVMGHPILLKPDPGRLRH